MYPRKCLHNIKKYLYTREIIVIHGARQTGKTTLLSLIMQDIPKSDTAYFDLEDSRLRDVFEGGAEMVEQYVRQKGLFKDQKIFYIIIDEVQYLSNPSSLLKILHDHFPQFKVIASGSSSFNIKKKFKDTLVGRTVDFELHPLDFEEFLNFKDKDISLSTPITVPALVEELDILYREYTLYGGYPKIVLTPEIDKKETYLQQIIDTYINNDIRDIGNIRHVEKFNKLVRILASQSGELLNVSELSNTTGISRQSIEEYLFILENTYIIKMLQPFSKNIRSELFKKPKVFFLDTGIMNMLRQKALPADISGDMLETAILSDLMKEFNKKSLFFWRTQDKKELDFVVQHNSSLTAIEVKLNAAKCSLTPMRYFNSHYSPKLKLCVSLQGKVKKNDIELRSSRPWDLIRLINGS